MSIIDAFIEALPMGLDVAGNLIKAKERKRILKRQNQVSAEFLAKQRGLSNQAGATTAGAIANFTPEAQGVALDNAATRRMGSYSGAAPAFLNAGPMRESISGPTSSALARGVVDAIDRSRQNAAALAKLGAHNDVSQANALALQTAGRDVGRVNNFAQGNQGVYGMGFNAASMPNESLFGDSSLSELLRNGSTLANIMLASRRRKAPVSGPSAPPLPGYAPGP